MKFVLMSYNTKLGIFSRLANLGTKLKTEESDIIALSGVLSNKMQSPHYKCQFKTIFIFVN